MIDELCVQVGIVVVVIAVLLDAALAVGAYRVWKKERGVPIHGLVFCPDDPRTVAGYPVVHNDTSPCRLRHLTIVGADHG